jgi:hypothetical protein
MKFRTIGISNDLCPEGQEIDVWYHYERVNNERVYDGNYLLQIENVVNAANKSILWMLSEKYLRELAEEIEQMDGQKDEDMKSAKDDEKYLAYKECTL